MTIARSRLRDRPHRVYDVEVHMTPRQAEAFYDALFQVAESHHEPWQKTKRDTLAELRRRIIAAAELEIES